KEAPEACRNFTQLCMEGYYDGTVFHRVVPEFIVQGGDPTGTGTGGESIYGRPFKVGLDFCLVAMANAGPHDDGSQFFFTLGRADELNNKHTIFGKVTGDAVYNILRLAEVECDRDERPLNTHKIRSTEVLPSPFDDIIPREIKIKKEKNKEEGKKSQSKATKYGTLTLLNFYEFLSFIDELRKEARQLKKELLAIKQRKEDGDSKPISEAVTEYLESRKKYEDKRKQKLKKGSGRESQTLALLERFKSKLSSAISESPSIPMEDVEELGEDDDKGWMAHVLNFDEQNRKVKDANMQDGDTFEIYDPRNPVNKRRREESKKLMKEKKARR
uniref:Spliceosome-associated protein CWC27 homolog n=1 Tax=Cyprinus carpio TaxID=7962 RepID=A0A8C2IMN8_CYPCA